LDFIGKMKKIMRLFMTLLRRQTLQTIKWQDYGQVKHGHHTVVGTLKIAQAVESPQLHNRRDILIYLPPSYDKSDKRYPVLYMHDGQNLFDNVTSYVGEWCVDETMERLSREENLEAIIVGIPNMGAKRLDEYSPFSDSRHGGGLGNLYVSFIGHTLKPLVDRDFRTLPDKKNTGLMGSSMGGLISLYAYFQQPDIFGFTGAMSPSLWFAGGVIYAYIEAAPFRPGKIYMDAGTREMGDSWSEVLTLRARSRSYYASVRRMKRILVKKGYRPIRDLLYIEGKEANHSEAAWGRRLPSAIRFFLQDKATKT
jgi:predicted alpha/beta superfamily hydrolase